ncbi:MAG: hypothetical protein KDA59_04230, partial [Planctomycetales bacterium]|nr:hypothetical protein [Planctomycetales bacterium]
TIAKYELTPRQAILYLRQLNPNQSLTLRYRLRATMPVKVTAPAAQTYLYYSPTDKAQSEPRQLEVTET